MNEPIFVIGCDRSGTTLLSLLLRQSPDVHITLESGFIPELYHRKDTYGDFNTSKERWYFIRDLQTTSATSKTIAFDIFEISDDEAEITIRESAPTNYAGAIDALFSETAKVNGKGRWGNKTPKYVHHIDLLTKLFPGLKIVHLVRDPRDVASSIVRAGWTSTIKEAAIFWNKRLTDALKGRSLGAEKYYELKYESLLEEPVNELKKLCEWLNIQFNKSITDNYKSDSDQVIDKHEDLFDLVGKPIDQSRAYAWKQEMGKADIAEIEEINKDLMQELDYELTNFSIPLKRKLYRFAYNLMKKSGKRIGNKISERL